ncbi:MAG: SH3 domain-containing protein [Romboutsia timonensis]
MALYQPSFCIPKNQAIDATDENDMTFSFKLNGNNPLVAYNIQIFDNDTNNLVYELTSTENERAIQAKIEEVSNWLENQETKQERVNTSEDEYNSSEIKTNFRNKLKEAIANEKKKLLTMETILNKKKDGKLTDQTDISKYFEYWGNILTDLGSLIGNEENPLPNTGEYVLNTIEGWLNIDPARTDGIEYEDEEVEIIDRTAFNKIKELYISLKQYFEDVMKARGGASDTTYINDTTYNKAKQAAYLIYSEFSNEPYFNKDLYEAINSVWITVDFSKLRTEIGNYENSWRKEISQEEYALAHLSGGKTTQKVNVYKTASASDSNIAYVLSQGAQVAIIKKETNPPSGWYYICSDGYFGYIQSKYVEMYNIQYGKYYLEKPVFPTNYEGEQNTVYHQLPINVLENGKAYKWSVTLYWSTSGRYDEDDKIDGNLTSVENYFDTRKKPQIALDNYKQIFTIPFNYVTTKNDILVGTEDGGNITIKAGSSVRIITLVENDETMANIEYVDEKTNITYQTIIPVNTLSDLGLYNTSTNYILPSKKAIFKGYYEQEQFVSISYFRWVLYKLQYDSEEITEIVKDTGMIPSVDFKFSYDGFLNDEKYAIQIFVQTLDNVEVQTDLIKFKVSYIDYTIDNMLNAENSPIEHGIIVEWSNLRLIKGEIEGSSHYEDDIPTEGKTSLTLDEDSKLVFDKDKQRPLSLDFDANQILCTRFDEERPLSNQIYYTASGLDDNGEVISKTLEMLPKADTQETGKVILRYTIKTAIGVEIYEQEIIASTLYWYVIIMKKDGFVIFTKYAQGLFPALDQYPNLNKFTSQKGLYPDALTYLEEPSDKVEYNYQTIVDRDGNKITE